MIEDEKRHRFIGFLAQKALSGELPLDLFKKLEIAVNYSDQLNFQELTDRAAVVVADWLRRGGLDRPWTFRKVRCPRCSKESLQFQNKDLLLVICSTCLSDKAPVPQKTTSQVSPLPRVG
jgi:hypothetical protein